MTKQEHIAEIAEEIAEIKEDVKQAFQLCRTYDIPITEVWYMQKAAGVWEYEDIAWHKMTADQLDVTVCEIDAMIAKAKALHSNLSALAIKMRELENIDNYTHSDNEA